MSNAATKVWNLIEGRMTGATRDVPVPGFVIKHIDEVMENTSAEAIAQHPGDSHEARCERLAFYLQEFLAGVTDNMRPHATKEFCQVMACYIRNQPQSYSIDGSGCVSPVAA